MNLRTGFGWDVALLFSESYLRLTFSRITQWRLLSAAFWEGQKDSWSTINYYSIDMIESALSCFASFSFTFLDDRHPVIAVYFVSLISPLCWTLKCLFKGSSSISRPFKAHLNWLLTSSAVKGGGSPFLDYSYPLPVSSFLHFSKCMGCRYIILFSLVHPLFSFLSFHKLNSKASVITKS